MSIQENKAIIHRAIKFLSLRNFPAFWEPFAPESVIHDASGEKSLEQYKQHASTVFTAFPDFIWNIEDIIAEDDKVFFRSRFRGTHKDALEGIAPTGNKVDVTVMQIARIVDGNIVEFWHYPDELGLRRQLGATL